MLLPQCHLEIRRCIILGVTMAGSICSSFNIRKDNIFEVRIVSEKSAFLCLTHFITPILILYHPKWNFFELERSVGKYSIGSKIGDLVEQDADDTEWISNTDWSELKYWMYLLNS